MADFVIDGLGKFDDVLEKLEGSPSRQNVFVAQMAENLIGRTKNLTPVRTGRLRSSWSRTKPANGRAEVYNNTEYAGYVEWGHRIVTSRNGKKVFTGKTRQGRHMLRDAVKELEDNFEADAARILEGLLS